VKKFILICTMILFSAPVLVSAQEIQSKPLVPQDQQKRLDLMKSKGVEASLTILPVRLLGNPFDRVSEVLGLFLEEQGLKNIELDNTLFNPSAKFDLTNLADSVCKFVKGHPINTDYLLYAEMNGSREVGLNELRAVVVNKSGEIVWTDIQTSNDEAFKKLEPNEPMELCMLLSQRLGPQFGLNEETARAAKPGKLAAIMDERSGLPPASEREAMHEQEKFFKGSLPKGTLMIFPVRDCGEMNSADAAELTKMINKAGICKAVASKDSLLLKASREDPNELKTLWNLAREFREYVKKNHFDADYLLYADYAFNPKNWEQGYVHFVVCNRGGDWVIADFQNSHHPDYQSVKPLSGNDCSKLLVKRLEAYSKWSLADELRKIIYTSGIDTAISKFRDLSKQTDKYILSEDEMNMLGYELLKENKLQEAIGIFTLNVEAFPNSYNVYDSLGEAYAAAGNKEMAIKNYEKSLQLNPESQSGIEALKRLKSQ